MTREQNWVGWILLTPLEIRSAPSEGRFRHSSPSFAEKYLRLIERRVETSQNFRIKSSTPTLHKLAFCISFCHRIVFFGDSISTSSLATIVPSSY